MSTIYWDFFWSVLLLSLTIVFIKIVEEVKSFGLLILVLPIVLAVSAGSSMFFLSAVLRGVSTL